MFRVLSLGPGTYRVEVVKTGFPNALRESVNVGISETVRLDFTLEVSGVKESVDGHDAARRSSRPSRDASPAGSIGCSCRRCRSAAATSTT